LHSERTKLVPVADKTQEHLNIKWRKWTLRLIQTAYRTASKIFESIRRDVEDRHFDHYTAPLPMISDANVAHWIDRHQASIEAVIEHPTPKDFDRLVEVVWDELRFVGILA
jgi:hypothetical protein